jgi:very-short-patch-repair endonuclease
MAKSNGKEQEINKIASNENFDVRKYANSASVSLPLTKAAQYVGGSASTIFTQPMFFSPLHTPQNWQIASKRKEVYQWARFYYENEPKAAAGIDFYAGFPMNGFNLECKDKKVLAYFEHLTEKLNLEYWLRKISHEYFLLGDVFVFSEIECPVCRGLGNLPNGNICNHPDGTIKRLLILNPDFIEVQNTQLADEPTVALIPDDDLKRVVAQKKPKNVYDRIPDSIKEYVLSGRPIPLSPRCISHIRHKGSPYGTYGESLLRRLFTIISYKTKLMTANWIMAERHILPVRVVKVGNAERPASEFDIADVQGQLAAVANDPNLTIVTHHAFEMDFIGATGKIHDISNQLEMIGKEMLDGLMLPQTLLNGEMAAYSAAAVGVETLIRRLETWRMELSSWVEKNIFLPVAQMQGFVDTQKSKLVGDTVWLTPKIKWNDLRLRDNSQYLQSLMQLHDKGIISTQKLLTEFNIDFDQEVNRLREEQITAGKGGQVLGGGGDASAGGGMGGLDLGLGGMPAGGGGGLDLGLGGGGMPPGLAGPGPGGPLGAAPPPGGGAPPAPPMGAMASNDNDDMTKVAQFAQTVDPAQQSADPSMRVYKRGKEPKQKKTDTPTAENKQIFLTKPEQKLLSIIKSLNAPLRLFAQYEFKVPGEQNAYLLDFAFPDIMLNFEADGDFWHSDISAVERDKQRDMKLAGMGWRVVRIKESALNTNVELVTQIVVNNIKDTIAQRKALMAKRASVNLEDSIYYEDGDELKVAYQNLIYDNSDNS